MNYFTYEISPNYKTSVAYFSMEFAIHQALKIYSGGLGFLAGSHIRSAFDLKQNMIAVGMLWSYGYYDQARDEDRNLKVEFKRKKYYFLQDLNVEVEVHIDSKPVYVKAYMVPCDMFQTVPLILLSTDFDKNDYLSRTITHKLYDANEQTRIAQEIVLGIGGVKVLEALNHKVDVYHMNEGHSIPLVFELYNKFPNIEELREKVVFTTHTPEEAGNEIHNIHLLHKMGFFNGHDLQTARNITKIYDDDFSLTVAALRVAKIANGVSKLHARVSNDMWAHHGDLCQIIPITNAQNRRYWADKRLVDALDSHEDYEIIARKKHLKRQLFGEVADQTGKMFDPEVLTIVWARRFAEYKRPGLLKYDFDRFHRLLSRTDKPIQIIWAGKPYPLDSGAINIFNELNYITKNYKNAAVLIGYELDLSMRLKKGADIWLNTPRVTREASGTSGMSAAMNGAINFSIPDGWHPEFVELEDFNAFTIPALAEGKGAEEQDRVDNEQMMNILENKILPLYYDNPKGWVGMMRNSMSSVIPAFDSGRMVHEYYKLAYEFKSTK